MSSYSTIEQPWKNKAYFMVKGERESEKKEEVQQHFQQVRFMSRGWKSSDRESIPAAVNNFAISSFYISLSPHLSRSLTLSSQPSFERSINMRDKEQNVPVECNDIEVRV